MKRSLLGIIAVCSITTLGTQGALAGSDQDQQQSGQTQATSQSDKSKMAGIRLDKLMDAEVKSKSGEDLGQVEEFLVDPQTGKINFAVLSRGGFLGIGEKRVPVPWEALNMQSEKEFSINIDKDKLNSAPTTDSNYANLNQPGYTASIYRFYELEPSTAIGGGESPGGSQSGKSSSDQ